MAGFAMRHHEEVNPSMTKEVLSKVEERCTSQKNKAKQGNIIFRSRGTSSRRIVIVPENVMAQEVVHIVSLFFRWRFLGDGFIL
jgi:capsular polysaccharide biosynthesis protein